ncbi:MAG TPA: histidinol dehydrogenase, partial [Polyangia bacterium]|nr:histidinol dehydrogenase [Polyangia bacterium]
MLRIIDAKDPDYSARLRPLCERSAETPPSIEAAARDVIHQVRRRGDAAVREFTEKFEKRALDALELPRATWLEQATHVAPGVRLAIERAAVRVRRFHERETYSSFELREDGARVGLRVAPLARVGLYVPGGTARYPSTVVMTAVPAKVAGVREVIMTTPGPSPETLAAALESGVDRVFVIGGAQAIAAFAYGTESVPRVDKIVGPGNRYVACAKRLVYGEVGIDGIAGPTEILVLCDASADP